MRAKRSAAATRRKRSVYAAGIALLILLGCLFFVKFQKRVLIREGANFFRSVLSRKMGINLQVARITGDLFGDIRFEGVRLVNRAHEQDQRVIFRAKEIRLHYRFVDLISKRFNSRIEILIEQPEILWRSGLRLRRTPFPFVAWMRSWALSQRKQLVIQIRDMSMRADLIPIPLEHVNLTYENNSFEAEIPLRHLQTGPYDVSTVVKVRGSFEQGYMGHRDRINGEIYTEGSVINWSPLADEAHFDFVLSNERLIVVSSTLLGGIEVTGQIDLENDDQVQWRLIAKNYALSNLSVFLSPAQKATMPGRVDLDLSIAGEPFAPNIHARARIEEGLIGKRSFKAMNLQLDGVYPTVRVTDSKIMLQDGSVMRLAEKSLEIRELFSEHTFNALVTETKQDTVVWGDWEFKRPKVDEDDSEFLVQHLLGDNAKLQFREYRAEPKAELTPQNEQKAEVGFEYALLPKNALKVGFREDERYVGIEQKTKF